MTGVPASMRAVVLDGPGPPEALQVREVPVPVPEPGQVLIEVKAFGLNRSELHTRLGLADGVTFPRVLGIEATGVVVDCPGGELAPGSQVAALMGGMGRTIDGGYSEYTCVPVRQTVPFASDLDWATLGAVPEMLQTSYGSLTVGLDAQPGQSILIRGGTSSVGMATAVLARRLGMTVLSTTRRGDVVWASFADPAGSEPGFRRPVVVVQGDAFNASRLATVVVVPLTSNVRWAAAPGNVMLSAERTGLPKDSVANVSQIVAVDRAILSDRSGHLDDDDIALIHSGIDVVLDRA